MPSTRLSSADEAARLDAVRRYDILDTPPDGSFDRITQLAARFCQVPISTITIVDRDRIWFKSARGVDVDEIEREPGLCSSAVMQLDPYVVTDARLDPRTLDNSLVCGELGLRFYAAVPLTTSSGHNLGTLNVIDVEPRDISEDELATLRDLGEVVVDELELRLAARERVAAEAMREAAALRDAVVAGISHEMRTPLGVLRGLMSLQEAEDLTADESHELRTKQRRHLGNLTRLVQRFLDYASLEGDRRPPMESAPVDLVPVVEETIDLFDDQAITVHVEGPVPAALADANRTSQIVQELVNNATRFSNGRPIEVALRAQDATVRLSVTDHGEGIHPDDLHRVFDKAFRGPDSTGTGLGLYLARIFADAQDGHVEVDSTLGAGSTFTLVLPTASGHA